MTGKKTDEAGSAGIIREFAGSNLQAVGVKILTETPKDNSDKPEKPLRYSQLIRQAARGKTFTVEEKDISDPNPQLALGFSEPKYVDIQPRIQPAKTKALKIGPIEGSDVVLLILTPAQVMKLAQVYGPIEAKFSGEIGVEGEATAQPYMTKKPNVSFLCNSARLLSGYSESEVILGLPTTEAIKLAEKIRNRVKPPQKYSPEEIEQLAKEFEDKTAQETISWALSKFGDQVALANSFGAEDVVLTHMLSETKKDAKIFTLDTGRLNEETYDVWNRLSEKYGVKIKAYHPDAGKIEELVNTKGAYSFKENTENRRECCRIRKILPLSRALSGLDAWITGLRRQQSVTRAGVKKIMFDKPNNLIKISPLADWTHEQVWTYIKQNNIPYNRLHDEGYASIGCEPCTRAIKEGEDERAGRWWWEAPETKECGLHGTTMRK